MHSFSCPRASSRTVRAFERLTPRRCCFGRWPQLRWHGRRRLGFCSFFALLGVGESFNWPCAIKTTSMVLSPSERGLGNGIFNSGAAVGAVLTPLSVPLLEPILGWSGAFVAIGSLGFLWTGAWLWFLRGTRGAVLAQIEQDVEASEVRSRKSAGSVSAIASFLGLFAGAVVLGVYLYQTTLLGLYGLWIAVATFMFGSLFLALALPTKVLDASNWSRALGFVVRKRRFWILAVVSMSINVCWHFLVNWLPAFLQEDRDWSFLVRWFGGVSFLGDRKQSIGLILSVVPFLAADAGNLSGGWFSRLLAQRFGLSPASARKIVMAVCTLLISSGALVQFAKSNTAVIFLLVLMALGTAAFMANMFAFTQDVSHAHTGLVVGVLGGLANLCSAGFQPLAGRIKDEMGHYGLVFQIVGLLPFVGLAALVVGWGDDKKTSE